MPQATQLTLTVKALNQPITNLPLAQTHLLRIAEIFSFPQKYLQAQLYYYWLLTAETLNQPITNLPVEAQTHLRTLSLF